MEEGTFVEWLKQDGDVVTPGEPLFVLESDKAAENIEAIDAGVLRLGPDSPRGGEVVAVGQVIAQLVVEGETVLARRASEEPPQPSQARRAKRAITPRARRAAKELGVDVTALQGSGRDGRIRERDVRAAAPTASGKLIPHTPIRRTIAARMLAGVTQAAPVTLTTRADATNLVNLRQQFRTTGSLVPSYTDLLVKLSGLVLRRHLSMLAQWRDEGLFLPERIDIAIAVDAEAGLMTPVLRGVDRLPLTQLVVRTRELIEQTRAGKLTADDMRDATFTLTNLGMFGVDAFTPIVPLPQSAILGVGRIAPDNLITLSLTFDHRVHDGSPAARFLDDLRRCVEQPVPHLLEQPS